MSKIEWTDVSWNPTVGCTRVSPGCKNCYAFEQHDRRHKGYPWPNAPKQYAKPFREVQLIPDRLDQPLRWRKPRMVFVNSMSDLFHEDVPDEYIAAIFAVMSFASDHTFQILTKRPKRMAAWYRWINEMAYYEGDLMNYCWRALVQLRPNLRDLPRRFVLNRRWPLPNVWAGTSVENPDYLWRVDELLETPAAVRFVSAEPLLAATDFAPYLPHSHELDCTCYENIGGHQMGCMFYGKKRDEIDALFEKAERGLDWIIVGGESGPRARTCDVDWIRSIVKQCKAAGTACFVKQLGAHVIDNGALAIADTFLAEQCWPDAVCERMNAGPPDAHIRLKDSKGGDPEEWPEDLRVRKYPEKGVAPCK